MRINSSFKFLGILIFLGFISFQNTYSQCLDVDIEVIVDKTADPCNGPITLDAHYPGYNFLWNTGETTRKILVTKSDFYIVTVDDGMGCVGKDTLQVTFMDKPTIDLGPDPSAQCGGCVTLNPGTTPGLTYLWSTGQTTNQISYCNEGTNKVSLTVTNAAGCTASDTVVVTITPGLKLNLGPDITACDNAPVTLSPNITGTSYLWNTGETTSSIQVSTTGYYSLEISDGSCSGVDTIHVEMNAKPIVNLGPDPATQCGGCITLNAGSTPGNQYLWSNGATTSQISVCTPATYDISVIVKKGQCEAKDTVHFQLTQGITVNLGSDVSLCKSDYLIKSNLTGYSFLWNTGATTPDLLVTSSGTYYLNVTDGTCNGVDSIKVRLNPSPDIDLGPDPAAKCGGCQIISAPADPTYDYIWSTGETGNSIKYCNVGTHNVVLTVVNSFGCKDSDTIKVTIDDKFDLSINQGIDTTVCKGPVSLNASPITGASYIWSTGETGNSIQVNNTGEYIVYVYNLPGCSAQDTLSDTIDVTFRNPYPAPASITDLSECATYHFIASEVPGATYYTWTVPAGVTIVAGQGTKDLIVSPSSGNTNGTISVTASNSSPTCASAATDLTVDLSERKVFIPNAFTPNGDNLNDTWVIRNIQYYPDNSLVVLNRWGNEVYNVKHYNSQWDGSSLNEGSYFYRLVIKACGETKEFTGYVTIVR